MQNFYNQKFRSSENQPILSHGEYENCVLEDFNLHDGNLSGYVFIDTIFENCNLSLCKQKDYW